jgi:transposase-like protein
MTINDALLDQLLKDYQKPEDILGENGLLKQLTEAALERALQAELTHHLGYDKHSPAGNNSGNSRNGKSKKTLKGEFGNSPPEVPRDRISTFEPQIVAKGQIRFERLRRQDPLAACPRHDDPPDQAVPGGDLPGRSLTLADLFGHRCHLR